MKPRNPDDGTPTLPPRLSWANHPPFDDPNWDDWEAERSRWFRANNVSKLDALRANSDDRKAHRFPDGVA